MLRILTVGACAMVVILLLSNDASAFGKRRATSYVATSDFCVTSYGDYSAAYGGYAPSYGYAPGYDYAPAPAYAPGYGYGGGYGYDFGRPGYNPGGLGGPRSGLGVRPGMGFGGFGLRR